MEVSVRLYASAALPQGKNSQVPVGGRVGGAETVWTFSENNILPLAFEPRTVNVPIELPMLTVVSLQCCMTIP
jgi:hypothetical protein